MKKEKESMKNKIEKFNQDIERFKEYDKKKNKKAQSGIS